MEIVKPIDRRNRKKHNFRRDSHLYSRGCFDIAGNKREREFKISFSLTDEEKNILLIAQSRIPHPRIISYFLEGKPVLAYSLPTSSICLSDFMVQCSLDRAREIVNAMSEEEIENTMSVQSYPREKPQEIIFEFVIEEKPKPVTFDIIVG